MPQLRQGPVVDGSRGGMNIIEPVKPIHGSNLAGIRSVGNLKQDTVNDFALLVRMRITLHDPNVGEMLKLTPQEAKHDLRFHASDRLLKGALIDAIDHTSPDAINFRHANSDLFEDSSTGYELLAAIQRTGTDNRGASYLYAEQIFKNFNPFKLGMTQSQVNTAIYDLV